MKQSTVDQVATGSAVWLAGAAFGPTTELVIP
jgi:hypothetical protein